MRTNPTRRRVGAIVIPEAKYSAEAEEKARQQIESLKDAPAKVTEAEVKATRVPSLQAEERQLYDRFDEISDQVIQLTKDDEDLTRTRELSKAKAEQIRQLEVQVGEEDTRQRQWSEELGGLRNQLATLQEWAAKAEAMRPEVERLRSMLARRQQLKQIFGLRGALPLLIAQNAPEINGYANELLATTGVGEQLEIRTLGENGKEELSIKVLNEYDTHDLGQFSGGAQRLLKTALRMAVGKWRAAHSGMAYGQFMSDEAFDALDDANRLKMVRWLLAMTQAVPQIMVISHNEGVIADIPEALYLTKDSSGITARWG